MIISLLQPAPETFDLFDDIIFLLEGQIVHQGPRENVLRFFECGLQMPRKERSSKFFTRGYLQKRPRAVLVHKG